MEFRHTVAVERGPALQSGEVDMMSRNTTWTSSRDAQWGNFAQTMFYDGQGFMVRKDLGVITFETGPQPPLPMRRGSATF